MLNPPKSPNAAMLYKKQKIPLSLEKRATEPANKQQLGHSIKKERENREKMKKRPEKMSRRIRKMQRDVESLIQIALRCGLKSEGSGRLSRSYR